MTQAEYLKTLPNEAIRALSALCYNSFFSEISGGLLTYIERTYVHKLVATSTTMEEKNCPSSPDGILEC